MSETAAMTGLEHAREAERLIAEAAQMDRTSKAPVLLTAMAQVHATLAVALGVPSALDRAMGIRPLEG
jgi:hypothetical protein